MYNPFDVPGIRRSIRQSHRHWCNKSRNCAQISRWLYSSDWAAQDLICPGWLKVLTIQPLELQPHPTFWSIQTFWIGACTTFLASVEATQVVVGLESCCITRKAFTELQSSMLPWCAATSEAPSKMFAHTTNNPQITRQTCSWCLVTIFPFVPNHISRRHRRWS